MIAYCGLICSDCPAYRASQSHDAAALEEVLEHWRATFKAPHITVADVTCDGCPGSTGRLGGYCQHCRIRTCGLAHGVPNCAHCEMYPCARLERFLSQCDALDGFFAYATGARATLARIHSTLAYYE